MPADTLDIALRSLWIAACATVLAAPPSIALGFLFARRQFPGRLALRTAVLLPMVLPPVSVGLFLLHVFGPRGVLGPVLDVLDVRIVLTLHGAILACAVMAMPLIMLGAERGFAAVPRRLEQVAATLGLSRRAVLLRVTLPVALPGITYGLLFGFARGLGEFGATVLVAGIMPGRTETLSTAIYASIERFDDRAALGLAAISVVLAGLVTFSAERLAARESV